MTRIELLAILLMAALTYLTRAGGLWLMALLRITPRRERMLRLLSGSVLAALLMPVVLAGDEGLASGVAATLAIAVLTRRALLAMAAGVVVAVMVRL